MTPLALAALYAVVVCTIFGTVSETIADHETRSPTLSFLDIIDKNHQVFNDASEAFSIDMKKHRTNYNNKQDRINNIKENVNKHDEIYTANDEKSEAKKHFMYSDNSIRSKTRQYNMGEKDRDTVVKRVKRNDDDCAGFKYIPGSKKITHPIGGGNGSTYRSNSDCVTMIDASTMQGKTISLDFVEVFHIEDSPTCEYDYLEIRDGKFGYAKLLNKFCGEKFPRTIKSSGPYLYLKFHSDATIEYEGFHINVNFELNSQIKTIHRDCYINDTSGDQIQGVIDTSKIPDTCKADSDQNGLDVLWTIEVTPNRKIYLNFTDFKLEKPNECTENYVEVFGAAPDIENRFEKFCGSMANSVTTKDPFGNRIYVHLFTTNKAVTTHFRSVYTVFRTMEPGKDACEGEEFNCEDNTCIHLELKCDDIAHCRLKADEDEELCLDKTESLTSQPHIVVILVIFSLILSGMTFVFLFKCIRKLVQDHKLIKEHIRQSCEDRLYGLDARKLSRDSQPRASLERENHTNEMYKKQRSHSHHKSPSSIDSDYIQETRLDVEEDEWRPDIGFSTAYETDEIRIEQNGRNRRSDVSKKEESIKKDSKKEKKVIEEEVKERKEIKDASVGVPDTKESGCQTRESLFQTGTGSSSGTDSGSNGQAFSTFGYSGATLARPSPAPIEASQITIELLKACPSQESKTKKLPDRRPMSNETTRSAPDVIIVSKPIR